MTGIDLQQAEDREKDILMNYKFVAPQYAQIRGLLMLVLTRILDDKSHYVERKPRQYPIERVIGGDTRCAN